MTPQHMRALDMAHATNTRRAHVRAELKAGRMTIAQALDDPLLAGVRVETMLLAVPRIGKAQARRILAASDLHDRRTIGSATDRQKHMIAIACGGARETDAGLADALQRLSALAFEDA